LGFELHGGEALQIAGPNGIGKSSLMRILAGLLRPYNGRVEHQGLRALSDERPALDAHRPLGEALAFWGRIDGAAEQRADFGLEDLLDVPVRYLSTGGWRRAGRKSGCSMSRSTGWIRIGARARRPRSRRTGRWAASR
jgi:heme exporter protein A